MGGKPIQISFCALRPRTSIPAIYQINQKSNSIVTTNKDTLDQWSGWHADNDKVSTESKFPATHSNLPSAESRICYESEKIIPGIRSENGILRDSDRLSEDANSLPQEKLINFASRQ